MYSFQHTAILFGIVTSCVVSAQFNEQLPLKGIREVRQPFPETPTAIKDSFKTVELPPRRVDFFTLKVKLHFIDEAKKKPGKRLGIPDRIVEAPLTTDGEPTVTPPPGGSQSAVMSSIIIVPDLECEEGFVHDEKGNCRELW